MPRVFEDDRIHVERLKLSGPFDTNAYVVTCKQTRDSVLVDAPWDAEGILDALKGTQPKYILMTHGHGDHVGALFELKAALKVPVAAHPGESRGLPVPAEVMLNDGDLVSLGKVGLKVLHTPGHTSGSLCFSAGRCLISGDTLFPGGPGHTRSPADLRQIIKSIAEKIFVLPDDTEVFPGHGDSTVLRKEKAEFAVFSSRSHRPGLCGDVLWLTS